MRSEKRAAYEAPETFVQSVMQARLNRQVHFPEKLFSDPAWDILLGGYAAELAQVRLTVMDACIASNVPASSAYRWIDTLEHHDLIVRRPNPLDSRRSLVSLSELASRSMKAYFDGVTGMPI